MCSLFTLLHVFHNKNGCVCGGEGIKRNGKQKTLHVQQFLFLFFIRNIFPRMIHGGSIFQSTFKSKFRNYECLKYRQMLNSFLNVSKSHYNVNSFLFITRKLYGGVSYKVCFAYLKILEIDEKCIFCNSYFVVQKSI